MVLNTSSSKGRILFVNPWIIDFAAYDYFIKPVGLLTLAHIFQDQNYDVSLLDCLDRYHPSLNNKKISPVGHFVKNEVKKPEILSDIPRKFSRYGLPKEIVRELLKSENPDVILITSGMTYWYLGVFEIIELLHEVFPGIPIILGGIYATLLPTHAKENSGADYIIEGNGLPDVLEIVDEITKNQSNHAIYSNFKEYPWPMYGFYANITSAVLLTSYGCPYRCPFCASHILSPGFIRKDPEDVFIEVNRLHKQLHIRDFAFYDDALLFKKETHLEIILNQIIENSLNINFHTPNGLSPKHIDENIANLMYQSGFKTIRLSFESSSPLRQKEMTSKISNQDLIQAVHFLRNVGFASNQIGCYILMGLPGQSIDEVKESIIFIFKQGVRINLASFTPVPGTLYWDKTCEINGWQNDVDPLLTNNAIFPLRNSNFTWEQFIQLRTWVAQGNQLINKGELLCTNNEFIRQGRKI